MKTVLLTGIGGSIGCHTLAHIFTNTDWNIIGVDSFNHKGITDRVAVMLDNHPDWKSRLKVITHDITAPFSSLMINKIGSVDYIISMASLSDVDASIEDPVPFIQNNTSIVLNMLELARALKPQTFIQISTDEVYGASGVNDGHPEWDTIVPSNPYSASKAAQEAIAIAYWRTYGVPVIITNTMNNFGEMQQGKKFPLMVQKSIAAGQPVTIHGKDGDIGSRFYLHSRNHSDALVYILNNLPAHLHTSGDIDLPDRYNIVGDKRMTNLELAQTIADLMNKRLNYKLVDFHSSRPGHDKHYGLDGSKLHKAGWVSPKSFEDSLKSTIKWQQQHPEWLDVK